MNLSSEDISQQYLGDLRQTVRNLNSEKQAQDIVAPIKKHIKNKATAPEKKLRALRVLNELVNIGNPVMVAYAGKKMHHRFLVFGRHRKQLADPNRASDLFGAKYANDQKSVYDSITFHQELLKYIAQWGNRFGYTQSTGQLTAFGNLYQTLKNDGVIFPPLSAQQPSAVDYVTTPFGGPRATQISAPAPMYATQQFSPPQRPPPMQPQPYHAPPPQIASAQQPQQSFYNTYNTAPQVPQQPVYRAPPPPPTYASQALSANQSAESLQLLAVQVQKLSETIQKCCLEDFHGQKTFIMELLNDLRDLKQTLMNKSDAEQASASTSVLEQVFEATEAASLTEQICDDLQKQPPPLPSQPLIDSGVPSAPQRNASTDEEEMLQKALELSKQTYATEQKEMEERIQREYHTVKMATIVSKMETRPTDPGPEFEPAPVVTPQAPPRAPERQQPQQPDSSLYFEAPQESSPAPDWFYQGEPSAAAPQQMSASASIPQAFPQQPAQSMAASVIMPQALPPQPRQQMAASAYAAPPMQEEFKMSNYATVSVGIPVAPPSFSNDPSNPMNFPQMEMAASQPISAGFQTVSHPQQRMQYPPQTVPQNAGPLNTDPPLQQPQQSTQFPPQSIAGPLNSEAQNAPDILLSAQELAKPELQETPAPPQQMQRPMMQPPLQQKVFQEPESNMIQSAPAAQPQQANQVDLLDIFGSLDMQPKPQNDSPPAQPMTAQSAANTNPFETVQPSMSQPPQAAPAQLYQTTVTQSAPAEYKTHRNNPFADDFGSAPSNPPQAPSSQTQQFTLGAPDHN